MQIVVLDQCTLTVGDMDFSPIDALGSVRYHDIIPPQQLADVIDDADVVLLNKAVITREILNTCKNLKYIGIFATGYNNIDLEAAREKGVYVANVPGYSTDSVAQHVFALLLSLAGSIGRYDTSVHNGDWVRSLAFSYFPYPITEIAGKTLGIFGFGAIGQAVAKIGTAFGMDVLISTRTPKPGFPYAFTDAETLFSRSDFLTFHCPLTEQTKGLVCARTLDLMKPTACLINTARGGLVVERELADALNAGRIAGAGLDVLTVEPMRSDNPLLTAKNCIITPHTAWASHEARDRLIGRVAENLRAWQTGKPQNIVNGLS